MKRKNGFTLIELLAVIVILAVIALIATPIVLNIINRARKSAAADSVYAVKKEAELFYAFEAMTPEGVNESIVVEFTNSSVSLKTAGGSVYIPHDTENVFEISGTVPTGGSITITQQGKISGTLIINGYSCTLENSGEVKCGNSESGNNASSNTGNDDSTNNLPTDPNSVYQKVELGDYIYLKPESTSYKITKDMTGNNTDCIINPSELEVWRVIRKNSDGTVDIVSDGASSQGFLFRGKVGYQNMVGVLNEIASQYVDNSNASLSVVQSTRHMGYYDQTEYITDDSRLKYTNSLPTTSSETTKEEEMLGGGDMSYMIDVNLVLNALGTLNSVDNSAYWLASRKYTSYGSYTPMQCVEQEGVLNCSSGSDSRSISASARYISGANIDNINEYTFFYDGHMMGGPAIVFNKYVRPILTLKANTKITSGSGISGDEYHIGL